MSMVQLLSVELDTQLHLELYLKLAMSTLICPEEIAVKVIRPEDRALLHLPPVILAKENSLPVIAITGWYTTLPGQTNNHFGGWKPWETFQPTGSMTAVDTASRHIMNLLGEHDSAWQKLFTEKCGRGYHSGFLESDGLVEPGYRLESCHVFPEWLVISYVHMYYGK